jgi:hypothetical protein
MFKSLLRDRFLVFLALLAVLIKLFSLNGSWVERYYTNGLYPVLSASLRFLFGWVPFSLGDLLYIAAGLFLLFKVIKVIRLLVNKQLISYLSVRHVAKYIRILLGIYILFNLCWGLNYDRKGSAHQLSLDMAKYSVRDLFILTDLLQQRLNQQAGLVDSSRRISLDRTFNLVQQSEADYKKAANRFPFLRYRHTSVKPSLYGKAGKYFGYTGYYNPFTAESQIKTSIPVFVKPFVSNHEIAHGLGYAKENEANFISFLVCRQSDNVDVRYSAYFEMYRYAFRQCMRTEYAPIILKNFMELDPRVKQDYQDLRKYLALTSNAIEPVMSDVYERFMKMNNQPKGHATYNEVIAWLIAYMKKYGKDAI